MVIICHECIVVLNCSILVIRHARSAQYGLICLPVLNISSKLSSKLQLTLLSVIIITLLFGSVAAVAYYWLLRVVKTFFVLTVQPESHT